MLLEEGARGSHRAGTKLPVATSQGSGGFQYQYMDVGVNLDARIARRRGELISLEAGLEISDVQETKTATPAIRAVRSNTWAPIKPGERTLISAFEDSSGKRRYEVEVTAQAVR